MQMQTNQMVRALMLDDATAAKFTPIYEKYLKELRECRMMNFKPRARKDAAQGTEANTAKETPKPVMTDAEIAKMRRVVRCWTSVRSIIMSSARFCLKSRS